MKLPIWLYAAGVVFLALFGISFHKERQLKAALKRVRAAEKEAENAQLDASAQSHKRKRIAIQAQLAKERNRPLADRVADSVREYKQRAGS